MRAPRNGPDAFRGYRKATLRSLLTAALAEAERLAARPQFAAVSVGIKPGAGGVWTYLAAPQTKLGDVVLVPVRYQITFGHVVELADSPLDITRATRNFAPGDPQAYFKPIMAAANAEERRAYDRARNFAQMADTAGEALERLADQAAAEIRGQA